LLRPGRAGDVVGIDAHERMVSAVVLDAGRVVGERAFPGLG
jgi:hypothetical protein